MTSQLKGLNKELIDSHMTHKQTGGFLLLHNLICSDIFRVFWIVGLFGLGLDLWLGLVLGLQIRLEIGTLGLAVYCRLLSQYAPLCGFVLAVCFYK